MGKLVDIKTENIQEFETLFGILKDVLNDTVITVQRPTTVESNVDENNESKDISDKKKKKKKKNKEIEDDEDDEKSSSKQSSENEGGIKIFNIDDHQTLLIFVKLKASEFLKFDCKYSEYKIGVELNPLYKQFKVMDKDGILSMYIDEDDKQQLNLDVTNDEMKCITQHTIKLLDLNAKKWNLPASKFSIVVTMDCNEFHKICRDMNSVGCEYMEITCTDKKITFACVGDASKISRTYENNGGPNGVKIKCPKKKKDELIIVKNIYELRYLTMFNKCNNICTEIQIFLKDEYPMFMQYSVASLGTMLVGLSPVVEKNINKNSNYDPTNDIHYERSEVSMKDSV